MRLHVKITRTLFDEVRADLARWHEFAAERVGFLSCHVASLHDGLVVLAHQYHPVDDRDYLEDPSVGAMLGANGFRKALQFAYGARVSMWHIHCHDHAGAPWFGLTDLRENSRFVPDFFKVRPEFPHGALVASRDGLAGRYWVPRADTPEIVTKVTVVGAPLLLMRKHPYATA